MRVYSREFRMQVVRRILEGEKVPAISRELGIHRKVIYEWTRRVTEGGESNLRERGRPRKDENLDTAAGSARRQIAKLEQTIAHQQLAIEFVQTCFAAIAPQEKGEWRDRVFQAVEAMTRRPGGLKVETMCELVRVPRSAYYRYLRTRD